MQIFALLNIIYINYSFKYLNIKNIKKKEDIRNFNALILCRKINDNGNFPMDYSNLDTFSVFWKF